MGRTIGSTILKATYGYTVDPHNDPLINLANKADRAFVASVQNAWAVDTIPIRKSHVYLSGTKPLTWFI